jgi:2,3-bisphosphoglycerate-independent phosphoglycerate mutase
MAPDYQSDPAPRRPAGPVLLLFVDGVGLAAATATNPLARAPMPTLHRLLGGPLTNERLVPAEGSGGPSARLARSLPGDLAVLLSGLDAGLGVAGLPQSATGQTALLTGENAPALLGRHATAFPGPQLRDLLLRRSLLLRGRAAGLRVTFANAFSPRYFAAVASGRRRHGAFTLATLAAGVALRDRDALEVGRAVTWDLSGDLASELAGEPLPTRSPQAAGAVLAALLADHDLVVFETFLPDLVGHRRLGISAEETLARLDALLLGLLEALPPGASVVLTSDHGNLEDETHKVHTANPVPLLVVGPAAAGFATATSLLDVTPGILGWLAAP